MPPASPLISTPKKIFITNGFSTIEPLVVARAIGPHIVRVMEPYQFTRAPTVRGQGVLPIHGEEFADFHFDVLDGGEFHWWKFTVPQVTGKNPWRSQRLTLNDMRIDFYGGQASGSAALNFSPKTVGARTINSLSSPQHLSAVARRRSLPWHQPSRRIIERGGECH